MGGRVHRKKFRAHAPAAQSGASKAKKQQKQQPPAAAAAAVAATFSDAEEGDAELVPVDNEQSDAEEGESGAALSRGQRKRMKRRSAFMRKMGLVQRVVSEKATQQKKQQLGAFSDIKELQDSLFLSDKELAVAAAGKVSQSSNVVKKKDSAAAATTSTKNKKLSGKQRQKLAVRELGQLKAVHTHPSFQNDPFAAIQMHLQNTVVQANHEVVQKAAAKAKPASSKNDMDIE